MSVLAASDTVTWSLPPSVSSRSWSVDSPPAMRVCACSPATTTVAPEALTSSLSAASVPVTATVSSSLSPAPFRRREVDVRLRQVGAGEVVDRHRVDPAEGGQVQPLDAVEIHPDVAEVPQED